MVPPHQQVSTSDAHLQIVGATFYYRNLAHSQVVNASPIKHLEVSVFAKLFCCFFLFLLASVPILC